MNDIVDFNYRDNRYFFEPESGGIYKDNPLLRETLHLAKQNGGGSNGVEIARMLRTRHSYEKIKPLLRQCYEHRILPLPRRKKNSCQTDFHITELYLQVSHNCNLGCRYCYADGGGFGGSKGDMKQAVAKKAVDFLFQRSGQAKRCIINFDGGEPFLNFPLVQDTVKYALEKAKELDKTVSFNISTNGTLLTRKRVEFLAAHGFGIGISIDGDLSAHDSARTFKNGRGSYRRLLNRLTETGIFDYPQPVHARATITSQTLNCYDTVRHLYDLGFRVIYLEPAAATNDSMQAININSSRWAVNAEELEKVKEEFVKIAAFYKELLLREERVIFRNFYQPLQKIHGKSRSLTRCAAGTGLVAVTPDGHIYPCYKFAGQENFCMGSIDEPLVLKEHATRFSNNKVDTKEDCKNCFARYICGGGCAYLGQVTCGDIRAKDPLDCQFTRHLIRLSLEMYSTLSIEAPGIWKNLLGQI